MSAANGWPVGGRHCGGGGRNGRRQRGDSRIGKCGWQRVGNEMRLVTGLVGMLTETVGRQPRLQLTTRLHVRPCDTNIRARSEASHAGKGLRSESCKCILLALHICVFFACVCNSLSHVLLCDTGYVWRRV